MADRDDIFVHLPPRRRRIARDDADELYDDDDRGFREVIFYEPEGPMPVRRHRRAGGASALAPAYTFPVGAAALYSTRMIGAGYAGKALQVRRVTTARRRTSASSARTSTSPRRSLSPPDRSSPSPSGTTRAAMGATPRRRPPPVSRAS